MSNLNLARIAQKRDRFIDGIPLLLEEIMNSNERFIYYYLAKDALQAFLFGEILTKRTHQTTLLNLACDFSIVHLEALCNPNKTISTTINAQKIEVSPIPEVIGGGLEYWSKLFYLATISRRNDVDTKLKTLINSPRIRQYPESHDPWVSSESNFLYSIATRNNIEDAYKELQKSKDLDQTIRIHYGGTHEQIPITHERSELINQAFYPPLRLYYQGTKNDQIGFNQTLNDHLENYEKYLKETDQATLEKYMVPISLIAACAYAHDQGIRITVESDYLPKWLIEGDFKH